MSDLLDRPLRRTRNSSLIDQRYYETELPLKSSVDAPAARASEPPGWLLELIPRFREYLYLPHGWDSYGGRPVSLQTVELAIRLLVGAARRPNRVLPTGRGGVQLEWDGHPEVELEVRPDGVIELLVEENDRVTEFAYVSDSPTVAGLLARL